METSNQTLNLYLDPYLIACPSPSEGPAEVDRYINTLLSWREFRGSTALPIHRSATLEHALTEARAYPSWDKLEAVVAALPTRYVQVKDLFNLVLNFLNKSLSLESALGIYDILADPVECDPTDHLAGRPPVLAESYKQLLVLVCLMRDLSSTPDFSHFIITRDLDKGSLRVSVSATIVDCQFLSTPHTLPDRVAGCFLTCSQPEAIDLHLDPVSLWKEARHPDMYTQALNIYTFKMAATMGRSAEEVVTVPWCYGRQFFETARAYGFLDDEPKINMLLRALAETVLNLNTRDSHRIRVDKGGDSPPLLRGSDTAHRRDIDRTYHLHYWQTSQGPEFASIAHHNNFQIPA